MAKKKAAKKKAAKKAPARTSLRGQQVKSRMSGRTKTTRRTNRGQKQQSAAENARQAPQTRKAIGKTGVGSAGRASQRRPKRRRAQQAQGASSAPPNKISQTKGRTGGASRTKSARAARQIQSGSRTHAKTEGRPRQQNRPYRADGDREREGSRQMEMSRSARGEKRGDSKQRRGPTGPRRKIQGGMHAESEGIQQAQGRWENADDMTPGPRRHRQQQSENDSSARHMDREMDDLDAARRHTDIRDQSEDEGYGRSEGSENRRMSQLGEYPADDDDQHYGRNLDGRNRIPGGGSRRNR